MSRYGDTDRKVARARIVARYTDCSVLDYLRREHEREGWA